MSLSSAILDGKIDEIHEIIRRDTSALEERSQSGRSAEQLAHHTGRADALTAVLRHAPSRIDAVDKCYSDLLVDYLSEISSDFACAGWLNEIEFLMWALLRDELPGDDPFAFGEIPERMREDMRFLSEQAGGWPSWESGVDSLRIVSIPKWNSLYEAWRKTMTGRTRRG